VAAQAGEDRAEEGDVTEVAATDEEDVGNGGWRSAEFGMRNAECGSRGLRKEE